MNNDDGKTICELFGIPRTLAEAWGVDVTDYNQYRYGSEEEHQAAHDDHLRRMGVPDDDPRLARNQ